MTNGLASGVELEFFGFEGEALFFEFELLGLMFLIAELENATRDALRNFYFLRVSVFMGLFFVFIACVLRDYYVFGTCVYGAKEPHAWAAEAED